MIVVILTLLSVTSLVTYSYFTAKVESNNINDVNVSSGSLKIKIDDTGINASEISPIYDDDYEMLAYIGLISEALILVSSILIFKFPDDTSTSLISLLSTLAVK